MILNNSGLTLPQRIEYRSGLSRHWGLIMPFRSSAGSGRLGQLTWRTSEKGRRCFALSTLMNSFPACLLSTMWEKQG